MQVVKVEAIGNWLHYFVDLKGKKWVRMVLTATSHVIHVQRNCALDLYGHWQMKSKNKVMFYSL